MLTFCETRSQKSPGDTPEATNLDNHDVADGALESILLKGRQGEDIFEFKVWP